MYVVVCLHCHCGETDFLYAFFLHCGLLNMTLLPSGHVRHTPKPYKYKRNTRNISERHLCTVCSLTLACSEELTENNHRKLQFPSALWIILTSFSSLFWFLWPTALLFWDTPTTLISLVFSRSRQLFSAEYLLMIALYVTCPGPNSRQTKLAISWWT